MCCTCAHKDECKGKEEVRTVKAGHHEANLTTQSREVIHWDNECTIYQICQHTFHLTQW